MIITCPNCATRYDVDDDRFSPSGRSVRCAECNESWFVPAPQPIEDLIPLKKQSRVYAEEPARERTEPVRSNRDWRDDAYEENVEEPLFEATLGRDNRRNEPPSGYDAEPQERRSNVDENESRRENARSAAESAAPIRDKKGRFIKAKKAEPEQGPEPSFARSPANDGDRPVRRVGEDRRFGRAGAADEADEGADRNWSARDERAGRVDHDQSRRAELRAERKDRGPAAVDADFEDVDRPDTELHAEVLGRGFGRKVREERRRETAIARIEDLEPLAERLFNDEFFAALRVQPKELERAIRKARRRAEAREKNRLTPLRALGWSAWLGAIAACAFVAYSYRNNIVAMFPNAADAYKAVGIEANPYGLKIEGVTHRVAMSPEGPVIEILGRLRNEEKADVAPPMLQAEALGPEGEVLSRWTFAARAATVRTGEYVDFSTRAPAPDGVSEVILSFAPIEGVKVSVGELLKAPSN
ncbi:MAG: zinc-ribbon domain-containing protein [Pseudomonadota bacterium]